MTKKGMTPEKARLLRLKRGLGERNLQKQRVKRGLSQAELSEISGVTKRSIQLYENGDKTIDIAKLETICDLAESLNVKIEDILQDEKLVEKYKKVK